eukprot:1142755-Pelagomonas_calceolata.AAC.2
MCDVVDRKLGAHMLLLLGMERVNVPLYGADKQKWSSIRGALKKGDVKDGEVSLVVERRRT